MAGLGQAKISWLDFIYLAGRPIYRKMMVLDTHPVEVCLARHGLVNDLRGVFCFGG